jgi:S1-C subfamily serine protease
LDTQAVLDAASAEQIRTELRARKERERTPDGGRMGIDGVAAESSFAHIDSKRLVVALAAKQKVIYGVDDRKDFYEFPGEREKTLARSVAALFEASSVSSNGDGTSTLRTVSLKDSRNVCQSERFADQPVGAFCTGFLVGPDLVATAGHCVDAGSVTGVRFVFGFHMLDDKNPALQISDSDIYAGRELAGRVLGNSGEDWALVRLDREAVERPALPVRTSGSIEEGEPVFVMGHPSGLPLKFADGAQVRDNSPVPYFVANLDTYGGNSGSPVFGKNGIVEGILVRGETDYLSVGDCSISFVCPTTGCGGEHCTRITEVEIAENLAS